LDDTLMTWRAASPAAVAAQRNPEAKAPASIDAPRPYQRALSDKEFLAPSVY
jgi:hypothetical protein